MWKPSFYWSNSWRILHRLCHFIHFRTCPWRQMGKKGSLLLLLCNPAVFIHLDICYHKHLLDNMGIYHRRIVCKWPSSYWHFVYERVLEWRGSSNSYHLPKYRRFHEFGCLMFLLWPDIQQLEISPRLWHNMGWCPHFRSTKDPRESKILIHKQALRWSKASPSWNSNQKWKKGIRTQWDKKHSFRYWIWFSKLKRLRIKYNQRRRSLW